jgi:hypothetical protein
MFQEMDFTGADQLKTRILQLTFDTAVTGHV